MVTIEPENQWQTIDDQGPLEQDPAFISRHDIRLEADPQAFSRRPAALVGMTLMVIVGTAFWQSLDGLRGQVSNALAVSITATSLEPNEITIAAGESITFTNTHSNPQYLVSDDLCDANFECLNTATMFQGDSYTYTLPIDVTDGTYHIFAPLQPDLTAEITVGAAPVTISTEPLIDEPLPPEPISEVTNQPPAPKPFPVPESGEAQPSTLSAFQNPTEPSEQLVEESPLLAAIRAQLESDSQGNAPPVPVNNQPTTSVTTTHSAIPGLVTNPHTVTSQTAPMGVTIPAAVTHQPIYQPETGPRQWLVFTLAGLLLLIYYRKYRKSIVIVCR